MSTVDESVISEHDVVVLVRGVPEYRLEAGDTGVVIDIGRNSDGKVDEYLLEIFAANGSTLGLVSVEADWVRRARSDEVTSVRRVAAE